MFRIKAKRNITDEGGTIGDEMNVLYLTGQDPTFMDRAKADEYAKEWTENYAGVEFIVTEEDREGN